MKHISEIIGKGFKKIDNFSDVLKDKTLLTKYLQKNINTYGQYIVAAYLNERNTLIIETQSNEISARLRYEDSNIKKICSNLDIYPKKIKFRTYTKS
mgnify:FL=1